MERLCGIVERITYQNAENGYSVLKVDVEGFDGLVTVVGNLLDANIGSVLMLEGNWEHNRNYGNQFHALQWRETVPATTFGIEKYLGSGLIKGIGAGFAKRIVDTFGINTLDIIENSPERLSEVDGIGKKRIGLIKSSWEQQKEIRNIMVFLQSNGVGTSFAAKIYKRYGKSSIEMVMSNPYCLADDISGIGFKTADRIALNLGFRVNSLERCRSGIMYSLKQLANTEGHVYAEREQLIAKCTKLLGVEEKPVEDALGNLIQDESVILDEEAIYLRPFYMAESGVARRLRNVNTYPVQTSLIEIDIDKMQKRTGIEYNEAQKQAIEMAVASKIMILTGGPGTGKTTTVLGIINALKLLGCNILLAAPTGRAAKRMSEATGMEAKTIHRLLEYNITDGYNRNENNPLDCDALILDEASMIDLILMNTLTKAIPPHMRLIIVGDIDQLPSVGAGNVLRDLIDSGEFPVIMLKEVFRQAQSSRIIMNAHRINSGQFPDLNNRNTDFFYIEEEDAEKAAETIRDLVKERLPRYYGVSPLDIQVLSPMRKGIIGTENLNRLIQEAVNPSNNFVCRAGRSYHVNDKVMQTVNNYEKDVFNGDTGIIRAINEEDKYVDVQFDLNTVRYEYSELDELVQAYATTIHKSQGSEYPVVVMPVMMNHYIMLQRNLIYTGITRAKKILVLVGNKKAIGYAVRNVTVSKRNTKLKERLQKSSDK